MPDTPGLPTATARSSIRSSARRWRRIPRTGPPSGVRRNNNGSRGRRARVPWTTLPVGQADEFIVLGCERSGTAPARGGIEEIEDKMRGLSFVEEQVCRMPRGVSEYERVLAQRGYRLFERYVVDARMAGELGVLKFKSPLAAFTDATDKGGEWFLLFLNEQGEVVEYGGVSGRSQNLGRDFEMGWYVGTVGMCRGFLPLPRL